MALNSHSLELRDEIEEYGMTPSPDSFAQLDEGQRSIIVLETDNNANEDHLKKLLTDKLNQATDVKYPGAGKIKSLSIVQGNNNTAALT